MPKRRNKAKVAKVYVPGAPEFLAGDVILFASKEGDFYGRFSGWLQRNGTEGPTYAVHSAHFIDSKRVLELDVVGKVKSVADVLNGKVDFSTWQRRGFEVWRCTTLTPQQREAITRESLRFVDVRFGFLKFFGHLFDDLLVKLTHKQIFFFRHLDHNNTHPVCSGIIATVYDRATGYRFGVEPDCADPDQIDDWVRQHPDEWKMVFALEEYGRPAIDDRRPSPMSAAN